MQTEPTTHPSEYTGVLSEMEEQIRTIIVGQDRTIRLLLTAFLAGGHVLLEDVPGTGKTLLAKTMAASLGLSFSRIQFTPDLLPSDITGLSYYNQKTGDFNLRKGPVFANIILADEINRATPRTQSSLLEAMEERQVTIEGTTLPLTPPFFVIATQNPVETAGTYPLPEAQLDRFLMKLHMGYPDKNGELEILNRFGNIHPDSSVRPHAPASDSARQQIPSCDELFLLQDAATKVFVHPMLRSYLVDLVQATRQQPDVICGASPRSSLAFLRAVKSYAFVNGRDYVVPEDIKELALPVLAHRVVPIRSARKQDTGSDIITRLLASVPLPTEDWSKRI